MYGEQVRYFDMEVVHSIQWLFYPACISLYFSIVYRGAGEVL